MGFSWLKIQEYILQSDDDGNLLLNIQDPFLFRDKNKEAQDGPKTKGCGT
jgi:hypothetical protein